MRQNRAFALDHQFDHKALSFPPSDEACWALLKDIQWLCTEKRIQFQADTPPMETSYGIVRGARGDGIIAVWLFAQSGSLQWWLDERSRLYLQTGQLLHILRLVEQDLGKYSKEKMEELQAAILRGS